MIVKHDDSHPDESGMFHCTELDDEEYERRRSECLDDMSDLEKQFSELKEQ